MKLYVGQIKEIRKIDRHTIDIVTQRAILDPAASR